MAKKEKPKNVEKIVKRVNKKFTKTTSHIESLFSDALKQFDNLQAQIKQPVHKLRKDIDELRDREMKRFNNEFERRLQEFQTMQNSLLERLGIGHTDENEPNDKKPVLPTPAVTKKKKATPSPAPAEAPAKAPAQTPAKTKAKTTQLADPSDLTRVKGIGPATQKKMKEAGLTTIGQIAYPCAEDQEKLKAFASIKNFDRLAAEAQKIV